MERMLFPKQIQKKIKTTKEEDEICFLVFFWFFFSFMLVVEAPFPIVVKLRLWFASSNSESLSPRAGVPGEGLVPS